MSKHAWPLLVLGRSTGTRVALFRHLYNPLDVEHFRPDARLRAESRQALNLREDEVLVGFVRALAPEKGAFRLAHPRWTYVPGVEDSPRYQTFGYHFGGFLIGLVAPILPSLLLATVSLWR